MSNDPTVIAIKGPLTDEGRMAIMDYTDGLRKTSILFAFGDDVVAKTPLASRYGPIPKKEPSGETDGLQGMSGQEDATIARQLDFL
jgi:hypothetical protein